MKKAVSIFLFLLAGFQAFCQPSNERFWVGPASGADLSSSNWSTASGGVGGAYPFDMRNYQLVFDGSGAAGQCIP